MLLNSPCILKASVCLKHSEPNVCTKVKFWFFTPHTANLFTWSKHLLTTNMSVLIQWVLSPLSLGLRGNLDWWSWMMHSFHQTAQQQICISRQLTSCQSGWSKLKLLCGILLRPLQVSRNQDWDSSTSSHPWCTECHSICLLQPIPRSIHCSTSNYVHSTGYSQHTSTNAT